MLGTNNWIPEQLAREYQQEYRSAADRARLARQAQSDRAARLPHFACHGLSCLGRLLVALGKRLERLDLPPAAPSPQPSRV